MHMTQSHWIDEVSTKDRRPYLHHINRFMNSHMKRLSTEVISLGVSCVGGVLHSLEMMSMILLSNLDLHRGHGHLALLSWMALSRITPLDIERVESYGQAKF